MPLNQIFNENYTYTVISIVKDSIYQGIIATLPENPIFLKLIHFMIMISNSGKPLRLEVPYEYIIFTKDFWNKIKEETGSNPKAGINTNNSNSNFNYYLFQEVCSTNKNDCYDGLDKHKMCCHVHNNGKRIIKTRYSDFPW